MSDADHSKSLASAGSASCSASHHSTYTPTCTTETSQATGWAAVEKALTDFDRKEVEGYKDDIDTLLVFAGLYSAVLTAFVVESYTQLQEDTAGETLQVLRQIANQTASYVIIGAQLLNTTAVTPSTSQLSPSPFQPTATAIVVNVLWFSSLIISLSAASLGILVKQWLREYLAFSTSSAQGQVRIREFRREGLETWKVLGIASILPQLLQLSLLSFFVGLCFFTSNIHSSIGNTTLPLVCAWVFLIFITTIVPVLSARCPYKTPAFRPATTFLRSYTYSQITTLLPWCCRSVATEEETDVIRDERKDLDILVSADVLQANDDLLGSTMKDALIQSSPTRQDALDFICKIVGNRVPWPSTLFADASQLDIELLSPRARAAIADMFLTHVLDANMLNEFRATGSVASAFSLCSMSKAMSCIVNFVFLYDEDTDPPPVFGHVLVELVGTNVPVACDAVTRLFQSNESKARAWIIRMFRMLCQPEARVSAPHTRAFLEWVLSNSTNLWFSNHEQGLVAVRWSLSLACRVCRDANDVDLIGDLKTMLKITREAMLLQIVSRALASPLRLLQAAAQDVSRCLLEEIPRAMGSELGYMRGPSDMQVLSDAIRHAVVLGATIVTECRTPLACPYPQLGTMGSSKLWQVFLSSWIAQRPDAIFKSIDNSQLWQWTIIDYDAEAMEYFQDAVATLAEGHFSASRALCLSYIITHIVEFNIRTRRFDPRQWRSTFNTLALHLEHIEKWRKIRYNDPAQSQFDHFIERCWASIARIDEVVFKITSTSMPDEALSDMEFTAHSRNGSFQEEVSAVGDYFCSILTKFRAVGGASTWRARRLHRMSPEMRDDIERRGNAAAKEEKEQRSVRAAQKKGDLVPISGCSKKPSHSPPVSGQWFPFILSRGLLFR